MGNTPAIKEYLTRDPLSAKSQVTADGKKSMMVQPKAFRSAHVAKFQKHLLRQIGGKLLVIWDGSPIHRSNVIKDCLASGAMDRISLDRPQPMVQK
ncbi:MAG: hypothetical protein QF368_15605 [SAR202 cluster bacterium]|nr:hypothetical protein [SAR202 cluster bacterium]